MMVSDGLFGPGGLLASCAVIVSTADPWWVGRMPDAKVALLRSGCIEAQGSAPELRPKGFATGTKRARGGPVQVCKPWRC